MSKILFALVVLAVICTSINNVLAKPEADSVHDLERMETSLNREKRGVVTGLVKYSKRCSLFLNLFSFIQLWIDFMNM